MKLRLVRFVIVICLISAADSLLNLQPLLQLLLGPPEADPCTGTRAITVGSKCVDVTKTANGTPLQISTCKTTTSQQWATPGDGTIRVFGKCMQVYGQTVQLYDCNGTPAQQWVVLSSGQLQNVHSYKCLLVKDGIILDNQPLIMYDCYTSKFTNQAFAISLKPITCSPKPIHPNPGGICSIKVGGKCVNVPGGNSENWTQLDITTCNATPAQDWTAPGDGTIRALGKCMDVKNAAIVSGSPVQLYRCNGSPAQQWVFVSSGQLKNPQSNRCLDVQGGLGDGFKLIIYDCHATNFENQAFESSCLPKTIESPPAPPTVPPTPPTIVPKNPQPSGTSSIKVSGKCINVPDGNSENWTHLDITTCNATPAQDWTVSGDGTIKALGKCMDVKNGGTAIATPVQLYDCNGTPAQQWVFLSSGQLKNPQSNRCLDVQVAFDGTYLIIYDCHQTNLYYQAFENSYISEPTEPPPPIVLTDPQPSGICSIKVGGKCVDVPGGNSESVTQLDVSTCDATPAQTWTTRGDGTIRALGNCMDVRDGGIESLTAVQLFDCNESPGQQWVFLSSGQLKNPQSNRCLDVEGGLDGTNLIIYDCKDIDFENQAFETICLP